MTPSRKERQGRLASRAVQATFLIVLIVLWYLATTRWRVSPLLLPNPVTVLHDFWDILSTGEFIGDLRVTLTELAAAFAIAATSGVIVGYLISRTQYRIRVFEPLFAGIYSIPIILFLPLYVLFFGLGPASKIALGATISFFPIALNTIAGFGYVDKTFVVAARSMGASDYQLFRHVLMPAALPIILSGMRIGFTVALLSIIGSETIASLAGLGHRIVHLAEGMEIARMFAYIVFVVAIILIAMDDDFVPDLPALDLGADGPHHAGGIGAGDVEWMLVAVKRRDRNTEAGPDAVVVDAARHHVDEHFIVTDRPGRHHLELERLVGRSMPLLADDPCVHLLRHVPERRNLADIVEVFERSHPPRFGDCRHRLILPAYNNLAYIMLHRNNSFCVRKNAAAAIGYRRLRLFPDPI